MMAPTWQAIQKQPDDKGLTVQGFFRIWII